MKTFEINLISENRVFDSFIADSVSKKQCIKDVKKHLKNTLYSSVVSFSVTAQ